jgi:hypothetical protein
MTERMGRRAFLKWSGKVGATIPLAGLVASNVDASPACVEIDSEPLRTSLNYADPSPHKDKRCGLCGFFDRSVQISANTPGCGHCQIMTGPVNASAYCDAFAEAAKKG